MLELTGQNFTPNLRVWFGDVEAETMYRYSLVLGTFFFCDTFGQQHSQRRFRAQHFAVRLTLLCKQFLSLTFVAISGDRSNTMASPPLLCYCIGTNGSVLIVLSSLKYDHESLKLDLIYQNLTWVLLGPPDRFVSCFE